MFIGSINRPMRDCLGKYSPAIKGKPCMVLCCRDFTIEYVLGEHCTPGRMRSCDVSLYSSALGWAFGGEPCHVRPLPEFCWLTPYMTDAVSTAATVSVMFDACLYYPRRTDHAQRLWGLHMAGFPRLHKATGAKIREKQKHVRTQYCAKDAWDMLAEATGDEVVFSFPPTYAGGYEKMYQHLSSIFSWAPPDYKVFDKEGYYHYLTALMGHPGGCFFGTDRLLEDVTGFALAGAVKRVADVRSAGHLGAGKTTHIYTNLGGIAYFEDTKLAARRTWPGIKELPRGHAFGAAPHVTIAVIGLEAFEYYRDCYLSKVAYPAAPKICLGVFTDGLMVGCGGLRPPMAGSAGKDVEWELVCDFAVANAQERRLAKLVLLALTTSAVRGIIEEHAKARVQFVTTTVFTEKPVSMKYRGVFDLARRDQKGGRLVYKGKLDGVLAEVGRLWWTKYRGQ